MRVRAYSVESIKQGDASRVESSRKAREVATRRRRTRNAKRTESEQEREREREKEMIPNGRANEPRNRYIAFCGRPDVEAWEVKYDCYRRFS
jgi:hypothetical protein